MIPTREQTIEIAWKQFAKPAPKRFQRYIVKGDRDKLDAMARYLWNIKLCESLTPVLCSAEIMLKNTIHRAMAQEHKLPTWYDNGLRLQASEIELLKRTYRDTQAKNKHAPDDIVAELSLKFWVNLLRAQYSRDVWAHLLPLMPHKPTNIQRNDVEAIFNKMREVRNRAYHHEPIWHLAHLVQVHDDALRAIGWFSSRHFRQTKLIDTFPQVHAEGIEVWRKRIEAEMFPDLHREDQTQPIQVPGLDT